MYVWPTDVYVHLQSADVYVAAGEYNNASLAYLFTSMCVYHVFQSMIFHTFMFLCSWNWDIDEDLPLMFENKL